MGGYPSTYSDLYDPAFPQSPIGAEVELDLGTWTSIQDYVRQASPIDITRGRPDESSQITPSQCTIMIDNRGNQFSINNPMSPWFGLLTRNTPLRASLPNYLLPSPANTPYLRMEDDAVSYASTPGASALQIAGNLDIRVDLELTGYGTVMLAGVWEASASVNGRCWYFAVQADGTLIFGWTSDGTLGTADSMVSDPRIPLPIGRQVVRAVFTASTGQVVFYTAAPTDIATGPWTQLGATPSFPPGASTIHTAASSPLRVGYCPGLVYDGQVSTAVVWTTAQGSVYDLQLYNSSSTLVAWPSFATQTAGATAWTDAQGRPWALTGSAEISTRAYRYHGELAQTPKAADPSARDVYSAAVAAGVMRRIQQGQTPLRSPMYRAVTSPASVAAIAAPAVAYWPCEDAAGATQLASGLSGGAPMTIVGTPTLANSSDFVCSSSLPTLAGAQLRGAVPAGGTWSANLIGLLLEIPAAGETDGAVIARIYTTGTYAHIDIVYAAASGGTLGFNAYNAGGTVVASGSGLQYSVGQGQVGVDGLPALIELSVYELGGLYCNIAAQVPYGSGIDSTNANTTGSVGAVTAVVINPNGTLASSVVGHVFVCASPDNSAAYGGPYNGPLGAWLSEPAGVRVQRLATEEGQRARIVGHPALTALMGVQGIETLQDLLQECEDTDRGQLLEPRTCLGLGYRTLQSLYNQAATATAVYNAGQLDAAFQSTADDMLTLNDVTVSNADGSSARQVLSAGPMSIQAPPNGVSRVDTQIQANAAYDGDLAGIAGWVLHVSTDSHDRLPTIPYNMARPQTPAAVALLDIGDLNTITSPPLWVQADEIDQLAAGFHESFGPVGVWQIDVNGEPAYPFTIAQVDGAGGLATHLDTDGSQLTQYTSATAVTLVVATIAPYAIWTTNAADFPFDINVAGERMTVTNITGSSSPQTFTVTRSVNGVVKAQQPGASVALWYTPILGQITGA